MGKNGMGIELTEVDDNFRRFFTLAFQETVSHRTVRSAAQPAEKRASRSETGTSPPKTIVTESPKTEDYEEAIIVQCSSCGVRNKIRRSLLVRGPKCGKCRSPLQA